MLKLVGQTYIAIVGGNNGSASETSFAEVRMIGGETWVGDARITAMTVGDHDSKRSAAKALAKTLRDLADKVESSD